MTKYEKDKVYAKNWGYSIVAYDFYKCIKATEKSAWFIKLGKRFVSGDGQQGFVVCTYEPDKHDTKIKCVRQGTFMGSEYHEGEQLYEDHMD